MSRKRACIILHLQRNLILPNARMSVSFKGARLLSRHHCIDLDRQAVPITV